MKKMFYVKLIAGGVIFIALIIGGYWLVTNSENIKLPWQSQEQFDQQQEAQEKKYSGFFGGIQKFFDDVGKTFQLILVVAVVAVLLPLIFKFIVPFFKRLFAKRKAKPKPQPQPQPQLQPQPTQYQPQPSQPQYPQGYGQSANSDRSFNSINFQ